MKAAVFKGSGQPLSIENVSKPTSLPDQIVVKVAACGVCHTDLHYLDHGVPTFKKPPIILGHEAAGWVEAVGEGVTTFKKEQTVLIPAVLTCGQCGMCRQGRANICEKMQMLGNHMDGAFAEYVRVPARDVLPLPAEVDPVEACIVADAVTTAYHAVVNRAQVRAGDRVAIFGCGGVGLSAVQLAALSGAVVTAVDLDEKKLALAKELGAVETVNAKGSAECGKEIRRRTGGVDRAMECIGRPDTIRQAQESLRIGGRLCIVGYSEKPVELSAAKIMFQEQEVVGSLGCRPVDFGRVLDLVRVGRLRLGPLVTGRRPLGEIGAAFDDLRAGRSVRTVILPG
ncbi:MAG: zinc-binding dehydrogenase [Planctomycetes bacterium]|nr:zinc-binding dehydrogenase [Planctomycetota bacterium]